MKFKIQQSKLKIVWSVYPAFFLCCFLLHACGEAEKTPVRLNKDSLGHIARLKAEEDFAKKKFRFTLTELNPKRKAQAEKIFREQYGYDITIDQGEFEKRNAGDSAILYIEEYYQYHLFQSLCIKFGYDLEEKLYEEADKLYVQDSIREN
jgi:hypothetical protein